MHLRDTEKLCSCKHLRCFVVVTADLINTECQSIRFVGVFRLNNYYRNPVNQKHHIGAIALNYPLLRPFVGDMKQIVIGGIEVN